MLKLQFIHLKETTWIAAQDDTSYSQCVLKTVFKSPKHLAEQIYFSLSLKPF